jgi:hypothetical protein
MLQGSYEFDVDHNMRGSKSSILYSKLHGTFSASSTLT